MTDPDNAPLMVPGLSHRRGWGLTLDQMRQADEEDRRRDADRLAQRVKRPAPDPPRHAAPPEQATGATQSPTGAPNAAAQHNPPAQGAAPERPRPRAPRAQRTGTWWADLSTDDLFRF